MKNIVFFIIIFLISGSFFKVYANTPENLQLYPVLVEETFKTNDTKSINISLLFEGESPISVQSEIIPITKDYNNERIIFLSESQINLDSFFKFNKEKFEIYPNKPYEFNIEANYLEKIKSGTYAFAILFNEVRFTSKEQENSAEILRSVAAILLVTIDNGDLSEKAVVTKFSPSKNIFTNNNYNFDLVIKNEGASYIKPIGVLSVEKVLGIGDEKLHQEFNSNLLGIFSNTQREFKIDLSTDSFTLGKYKAEIAFAYGNANKVLIEDTEIYIIPWYIIAIFVLTIVFIFYKMVKLKLLKK